MAEENPQSIAKSLKGILAKLDGMNPVLDTISSSTSETADAVSKPVKPSNEEKFERQKLNERIVEAIKDMTAQFNDRMKVLGDAFKDFQQGGLFGKLGTIIQVGFAVGAAYFYRAYKAIEPVIMGAKATFMGIKAAFDKLGLTEKFRKAISFIAKIKDSKPVQLLLSLLKKFTGPGGKILGFLKNILSVFKPVLSIFKPILGIVSKLGKFLKAVPLLGQIITIIEGVYGAFKGFFGTEGSLVDKIFGAISGAIAQILQGLTFGLLDFDTTFEFLTGFFTTVREFFATYVPPIWESVKSAFTTVFQGITDFLATYIPPIWESVKSAFTAVFQGITDFFALIIPPIWEGMKQAFSLFLTGISLYFDYVLKPTWEGVKFVMMAFWEGLKATWEYLSPVVDAVLNGISFAFNKMYDFFVETVPGLFVSLIRGVVGIVKSVMGVINGALDYVPGLGPNTIDTTFLDRFDTGLAAIQGAGGPGAGGAVVTETRALNENRSRVALGGAPSTNLAVAPVTNVQNNTFTKSPIRSGMTDPSPGLAF